MTPGHLRSGTLLALLVPLIFGCATTQSFYDGPVRPRDQVALIPVYSNVRVDQRFGDVIHRYIALLPGRHTAEVIWPAEGASCKMEFHAIAGAEYSVHRSESTEVDTMRT